jgi:hypothetical protein
VIRVTSPGTGGLQARLRTLALHVPWSSSLTVRPRTPRRGGVIRLSGRLALRGFATTRARGARAAWRTSYRFGSRPGSYRIRARIRREGSIPYGLGYSRPVRVTVR